MWSCNASNKRRIPVFTGMMYIVFLLVTLSACGFQPLYKKHTVENLPNIEVANIQNREGQALRNILIDNLYTEGRPPDARYVLHIERMKERTVKLGIRKDATATRTQLQLSLTMVLEDRETGETVLKRSLRAINSYNILDNQYATYVAEEDARKRAMTEISDAIAREITLYFSRT